MTPALTVLAADTKLPQPVAAGWQLVLAALAGIALIVVLSDISTAPAARDNTTPHGASVPKSRASRRN